MKKKPRVYIEQDPRGWFRIYRLKTEWFGFRHYYEYVETAYDLETSEKIAQITLNPIIKEYE